MKWLLRTLLALSLLAGLGYASYAFGMYILSQRLFGDTILQKAPATSAARSATTIKSVTRKSGDNSGKPRVEVNVLGAQDAGPGPQAPSLDSMERDIRTRDYDAQPVKSRQRIVTADSLKAVKRTYRNNNPDGNSSGNSSGNGTREYSRRDNPDENRPRRRRRRRRRRTVDSSSNFTRRSNARRESADSGASNDSPSRHSSSSSERSRDSGSSSDTPRRERRIESPVPSESGGGSAERESPVPVPE